jgi:cell division protein FtsN
MEKSRQTRSGRDYSGVFLMLILIGIVVVVLGLMMAVAHSTARSQLAQVRAEPGVMHQARFVTPRWIYH